MRDSKLVARTFEYEVVEHTEVYRKIRGLVNWMSMPQFPCNQFQNNGGEYVIEIF